MKVFIDANVLIAVLNKEYPAFTDSARLLSLSDSRKFTLFTSPLCLAIAFYFSQKKSGDVLAKRKIALITEKLSLTAHTKLQVLQALANSAIHDLEDGLEYYSATDSHCACIVTFDLNDFYFSEIPVLTPDAFLRQFAI